MPHLLQRQSDAAIIFLINYISYEDSVLFSLDAPFYHDTKSLGRLEGRNRMGRDDDSRIA